VRSQPHRHVQRRAYSPGVKREYRRQEFTAGPKRPAGSQPARRQTRAANSSASSMPPVRADSPGTPRCAAKRSFKRRLADSRSGSNNRLAAGPPSAYRADSIRRSPLLVACSPMDVLRRPAQRDQSDHDARIPHHIADAGERPRDDGPPRRDRPRSRHPRPLFRGMEALNHAPFGISLEG